ncbi:hypothetical protein vseg_004658 [Gypsophila vaccaria]
MSCDSDGHGYPTGAKTETRFCRSFGGIRRIRC